MGCEIYAFIEQRDKTTNTWKRLSLYKKNQDGSFDDIDVYYERNYKLFGMLAGVRYGFIEPFVYPRGLPSNMSQELVDAYGDSFHTPTWYDYCELKAYQEMLVQEHDTIKRLNSVINALRSELTKHEEADKDVLDIGLDSCYDESDCNSSAEAITDFVNRIGNVLYAYNVYNVEPGDIRIVMWFSS